MEISEGEYSQRIDIPLKEYDGQIKPKGVRHQVRVSLFRLEKVEESVENQKNEEGDWDVCNNVGFHILEEYRIRSVYSLKFDVGVSIVGWKWERLV